MSVSYIDLSSDEEVEIISEKKVSSTPILSENATLDSDTKSFSAVEKLKRNCNIELTIDLSDHNEKTLLEPKKENGVWLDLNLRNSLNFTVAPVVNGDQTLHKGDYISSDIIVIDNDEKEEEVVPKKEEEVQKIILPPELTIKEVKSSNSSRRNSNPEVVQSSKVVVENGDEIFIIDDDDEEDEEDSVTMLIRKTIELNNKKKPQETVTPSRKVSPPITNKPGGPSQAPSEGKTLKKVILSVSKSPKKSPTSSSEPKPSLPSSSTTTPTKLQLPNAIISLPSRLSLTPLPVKQTKPNKDIEVVVLSDEPVPNNGVLSDKPKIKKVVILSDEPEIKNVVVLSDEPEIKNVVVLSDEPEMNKKTMRELRPRQRIEPERDPLASKPVQQSSTKPGSSQKVNIGQSSYSSGQSSSKTIISMDDSKAKSDTVTEESLNKQSIEIIFDRLVKVSCKIFQDENLGTRLWRYFRDASEVVLKTEDFLNALRTTLKSSEEIKNPSIEDKLIVSRNLKEVMRILKRQPERVNKTLRKLNKMLQLINQRILKLEEMEIETSDEETENVYVLLDRHRVRATKIYKKICELEGKAAHAGRATLQKFHFSGTSGHTKIEHALEKYFNKTRRFPDFLDVKKLIEATIDKEKLQIAPNEIHTIAQSIFLEFGNKLQRMRKCDDYTILVDYLDDGIKDPALDDEELYRKLEDNKSIRKHEEDILADYTKKQIDLKTKGDIKSDEEEAVNSNSEGDDSGKEDEDPAKKDLQFSDTEDELFNEDVNSTPRKRKLSTDFDSPSQPYKRSMSKLEVDQMEVNLKLVAGVQENRTGTRRRSSTDKDIIKELGLVSKGKQRRI